MSEDKNINQSNQPQDELALRVADAEQTLDAVVPDEVIEAPAIKMPPEVDVTASLYGFLSLAPIALTVMNLPKTAKVWNEQACHALASATIPVLKKYPWGQRFIAFLEKGNGVEEMALAAVVAPLALATHAAYQQDKADQVAHQKDNQNDNA